MWTLVSRYQNVSILDFVGAMCLKDAKQLWNMLQNPFQNFAAPIFTKDVVGERKISWHAVFCWLAVFQRQFADVRFIMHRHELGCYVLECGLVVSRLVNQQVVAPLLSHIHTHIILQNISKHRHMSNSSLFRQNIVLVSSDVDFMTSQDFYTANLGLNPAVTHSSLVLTNCIQPKLFLCTWDLDCMGAHLSLHDKEQRDTKRPYVTLRTADAVKVHCLWHVSCLQ